MQKKHRIAILTATVLALAWGGANVKEGFLPHWEGHNKAVNVAIHQVFDPDKVITVCSGITNYDIKTLKEGDIYTKPMCEDAEKAATPKYNAALVRIFGPDFLVSDHQHVAWLSFVYNLGERTVARSTAARLFKAGKVAAGCEAMGRYVRAAGVILKGLKNRRYDKFWGEIAWCKRND